VLEVNVVGPQLARQCPGNLLFGDETLLDENAAKPASGFFLLVQRGLELLLTQQFLLGCKRHAT